MDKILFDTKVSENGLKFSYVAESLGISDQALFKKRNGIIPFKVCEVKILKNLLHLTDKDLNQIFL